MSRLYIVPTPIGNLKDITIRTIEVLRDVDLVLAEDTRKSGILLKHHSIDTPLLSHHKFNEHRESERICKQIKSGKMIALITDAGTPGISDPGFLLVRTCLENNIEVETLPGPTAFIPALVNSGLPCDRFCFEGFLPRKKGRMKRIKNLEEEERTMVFYESPYRIEKLVDELIEVFGGDRNASLSRELTKIHEENIRGSLDALAEGFKDSQARGEYVLVVAGKGKS
ncbi:MAG: 16S rRNA (cytidine(1402)-2'-O)-methyltransferase [Bacteroidales bacterium]|jgi:16S rRNA (cytidine1402-2'-O)-methyltransferase|nr:16S rRNA (cytidine(1402)-2'-O)-methyltransferase [Bacteroidales bacterium]